MSFGRFAILPFRIAIVVLLKCYIFMFAQCLLHITLGLSRENRDLASKVISTESVCAFAAQREARGDALDFYRKETPYRKAPGPSNGKRHPSEGHPKSATTRSNSRSPAPAMENLLIRSRGGAMPHWNCRQWQTRALKCHSESPMLRPVSFAEILEEIPNVSFSQRQELVRRAIALDDDLTPEENALLDARMEEFRHNPDSGIPRDKLKDEIAKRLPHR